MRKGKTRAEEGELHFSLTHYQRNNTHLTLGFIQKRQELSLFGLLAYIRAIARIQVYSESVFDMRKRENESQINEKEQLRYLDIRYYKGTLL